MPTLYREVLWDLLQGESLVTQAQPLLSRLSREKRNACGISTQVPRAALREMLRLTPRWQRPPPPHCTAPSGPLLSQGKLGCLTGPFNQDTRARGREAEWPSNSGGVFQAGTIRFSSVPREWPCEATAQTGSVTGMKSSEAACTEHRSRTLLWEH